MRRNVHRQPRTIASPVDHGPPRPRGMGVANRDPIQIRAVLDGNVGFFVHGSALSDPPEDPTLAVDLSRAHAWTERQRIERSRVERHTARDGLDAPHRRALARGRHNFARRVSERARTDTHRVRERGELSRDGARGRTR